jgi:hypothetical protein
MGSPAPLVFTALMVRALGLGDDAWQAPLLEGAFDSRLHALNGFPPPLYPPDLEEEIAANLEDLARLDPDSAVARARTLLEVVSSGTELYWTARRVLAASGDLETVRLGLRSYFEAPARWREVLAVSDDPRLRDFGGEAGAQLFSERLFATRLERNLSRARERESIRALLAWASTTPDPSSPRRVLKALPGGVPLAASVGAWLRRNPGVPETPEPPPVAESESPLEIKQRVLGLPSDERYLAIRWLAERDHEALVGIPLDRESIDRLYPHLARSSRRTVRNRVRRAHRERGRALASILLSPTLDVAEKREALREMADAWASAIASSGPRTFEIMSSLLPREDFERFLFEAEVDGTFLDALALVPGPEARQRLEGLGTPEATERLLRRSDRYLSVPALSRLRHDGEPLAARSAALALLSLGGPGASAWLRAELVNLSDPTAVLLAAMNGSAEPSIAADLVRRVASDPAPSPAALAALARLHEQAPGALVAVASNGGEALAERAYSMMSLTGDRRYLPLLIDLVVGSVAGASSASREGAFAALAEAELGSFATRLHRLAGDPDREVRLQAAAALVPSGEGWTLRLLLGNVEATSLRERTIARRAIRRLPRDRARELLAEMVQDGTARSLGALLYLELAEESEVRGSRSLQEKLWRAVAEDARAGDPTALLAASSLSHAEAIGVVTARLSAR